MEFREMRRKRQQLSNEECVDILTRATSGVLSLLGDGGYPYGVPVSYVYADGKIFLHSAVEGHKVDAMRNNAKCSFCVVEQDDVRPLEFTTYFRSVIAFGKITVVEDDNEKLSALQMLGRRYSPNEEERLTHEIEKSFGHLLVLRIDIEHMTGKEAIELVRARQ